MSGKQRKKRPLADRSSLSRPASSDFRGGVLWLSLGLIVITIVVFGPLRQYGFVTYDDPQYVTENPNVAAGLTWEGARWALTTGYAGNWHPLTWLSHMLDVQMYGLDAGWHHVTNIALHVATTLLLFWLLRRMTGALAQSAFVAGLFAVHPLHVQSVAWIAERKDVLSALFWMLALLAYVEYVRRPALSRYLLVFFLFALGLAAKPMVITFPFVLLLVDFWPLSRISEGGRLRLRQLLWEKIPLFALTIASSIVTFVVQQRGGAVAEIIILPLGARLANALVSYVTYMVQMLVPARLGVFYPVPLNLPAWEIAGAAMILTGVSILVILAARRYAYLPVGWFWFLGTLVPVIGLIQVGAQARADRYTYIPLIGLFLIVAWGAPDLLSSLTKRNTALYAVAPLVIAACMFVARGQVQYWENGVTLWERALAVTSDNYIAENNLGQSLDEERSTEAIAHLTEALRLRPNYAEAHENIGVRLVRLGNREKAMHHFSEAVRLKPNLAEAHSDLAILLAEQGKLDEAIEHYNEALRLKPNLAVAHNNLGYAFATQGRMDEAVTHYSEALRVNPDLVQTRSNLGNTLVLLGRIDEAIEQYSAALRIEPDYVDARVSLGKALLTTGRTEEAIREFSNALAINPNYPGLQQQLDELRSSPNLRDQ